MKTKAEILNLINAIIAKYPTDQFAKSEMDPDNKQYQEDVSLIRNLTYGSSLPAYLSADLQPILKLLHNYLLYLDEPLYTRDADQLEEQYTRICRAAANIK